MADFTNFRKWAGTDFEAYILPIIPAGAKLKEGSKLKPETLGKIPGRYSPDVRAWAGFHQWQNYRGTARSLVFEAWQLDTGPIASGINTRDFPCFDIDCNDPVTADQAEAVVALELGPTPVVRLREGSARRTVMYERDQHTAPIVKHRRVFKDARETRTWSSCWPRASRRSSRAHTVRVRCITGAAAIQSRTANG